MQEIAYSIICGLKGGLLIQPFFDKNNNGKRDRNQEFYTEPNLILINNKPVNNLRPEVRKDHILIFLPPSNYRLDLAPTGVSERRATPR